MIVSTMARPVRAEAFVAVFMVFFVLRLSGSDGHVRRYISWDDVKVHGDVLGARVNSPRVDGDNSRVIVVDKNGKGDSVTVQGAVDQVPEGNSQRVKIYIFPGIYREKILVPVNKPYVSFIGEQSNVSDTIITWNSKASDVDSNGTQLGTYRSASVAIESDYFCATGITFQNTVVADPAGHGMQAVALRVSGDKAFFYKVRILGTQDTLLDEKGTHFFYQCHIQGSVDFIFGCAKSLFRGCTLQSTAKTCGAIAAHGRDSSNKDTGFSFVGCTVNGTGKVLLGRAWGNYSRVIYSYCHFADIIEPSGWGDWNNPNNQKTVTFGEFRCRGRGANSRGRVPWIKHFSLDQVKAYLGMSFISGNHWLKLK